MSSWCRCHLMTVNARRWSGGRGDLVGLGVVQVGKGLLEADIRGEGEDLVPQLAKPPEGLPNRKRDRERERERESERE